MSKKPKIDPKKARVVKIPEVSQREATDMLSDMRKKRGWKDGFAPHEQASQITEDIISKVPEPKGWYIPKHFCPLCKNTQVTSITGADNKPRNPCPGIWIAEESRPDLDIEKGDVTFYWICPTCAEEQQSKQTVGIWTPRGTFHSSEKELEDCIRAGAYDWIRSRKLAGDQPIRPGDVRR